MSTAMGIGVTVTVLKVTLGSEPAAYGHRVIIIIVIIKRISRAPIYCTR